MITYRVDDMTCGHCAGAITRAVLAIDPAATVAVDIAAHRVSVRPVTADAQALAAAITGAGYTPVPVAPSTPPASPARAGGCRCGAGVGRCAA